ncbi:hypothetical protein AYI70_g6968 [Smittium culicis]|uniref:Uncharacterized protein n=1 Tax=Smittium culicis TaxID=133412 RepID=A0A1R1XMK9_9FUNG|nr:hypothetical protein AYI70_g6968 [Smittium culicis]
MSRAAIGNKAGGKFAGVKDDIAASEKKKSVAGISNCCGNEILDNYVLFGPVGGSTGFGMELSSDPVAMKAKVSKNSGIIGQHAKFICEKERNKALAGELLVVLKSVRDCLHIFAMYNNENAGLTSTGNKTVGGSNSSGNAGSCSWNSWRIDEKVIADFDAAINLLK